MAYKHSFYEDIISDEENSLNKKTQVQIDEENRWIKPKYYNPKILEKKERRRGDERRNQAKIHSKFYVDKPVMWNHREFNMDFYGKMWKYQTPKAPNFFMNDSQLYNFIFGNGIETDIGSFIESIIFGKFTDDKGVKIYFIDNITLEYHGYSTQNKNYTLTFYNGRPKDMGIKPSNVVQKLIVAKLVILIMNESDPEDLNYTNYGNLIHWMLVNSKKVTEIDINGFGPIDF